MIVTLRKKAQITIPNDIVNKLNLEEGDPLDVTEQNGVIYVLPMTVCPSKFINDLKQEVNQIKAKISCGEQPAFDTVDTLLETLEQ